MNEYLIGPSFSSRKLYMPMENKLDNEMFVERIVLILFFIIESFNTNISHQLFDYKLTSSVKYCSLMGEGRRGWEGRLKNGVRMNHHSS